MSFSERLRDAILAKKNPVMVGLDPRLDQLPEGFCDPNSQNPEHIAEGFRRFCEGVLDVVAPLVAVVKPQVAFFEQYGPPGMKVLQQVIAYAHAKELLVVLDGKRNDIGTTARAYAEGMIGSGSKSPWGADAITVSPYLGDDSLEPFLDVAQKREGGIFVLVKTSNPGGAMLQDLIAGGKPIYQHIGEYVQSLSQKTRSLNSGPFPYGSAGAVVGATWPEQLEELRALMPGVWFLVPGFGAQGGAAKDVAPAFDEQGLGAIINNSRGIIFAHRKEPYQSRFSNGDWEKAVESATLDMIERLRNETPAGKLS